ncbi:MAG: ComEC/Rec2 family competence protein [Kiritimatiellae bacterium]|nr:ComEC/Rec2 family competence protein [Kiritimatiellia bacterium]
MDKPVNHGEVKWLAVCAALAAGEAIGFAMFRYGACWPLAAAVAVFAALFGYSLRVRGWPLAFTLLAGLALALASSDGRNAVLDAARVRGGAPFETVLRVTAPASARTAADGTEWMTFRAKADSLPVRVVAPRPPDSPLPACGERWLCTGWLDRDEPKGGGLRNFRVRGRGTSASRLPDDFRARVESVAARMRSGMSRRIGIGIEGEGFAADLNRAMLLGERPSLPRDLREDFVAAGTVHVFAVSGLHVVVVAQVILVLIMLVGFPYRVAGIVLMPVLWAYVFLIGFPPSAVRAALMASFYYAAPFFWRRGNALVAWCAAFICVHVAAPQMLMDVGGRLSFAVMGALVAWGRLRRPGRSRLADVASVTVIAWAAGVPIAAQAFGRFTAGGLLANLAAVPMAGVGVAAGALGCLASFVSETLAAHINNIAALATRFMATLSSAVASVPAASAEVAPWSWWECVLWYAALAAALPLAARRSDDFIEKV